MSTSRILQSQGAATTYEAVKRSILNYNHPNTHSINKKLTSAEEITLKQLVADFDSAIFDKTSKEATDKLFDRLNKFQTSLQKNEHANLLPLLVSYFNFVNAQLPKSHQKLQKFYLKQTCAKPLPLSDNDMEDSDLAFELSRLGIKVEENNQSNHDETLPSEIQKQGGLFSSLPCFNKLTPEQQREILKSFGMGNSKPV